MLKFVTLSVPAQLLTGTIVGQRESQANDLVSLVCGDSREVAGVDLVHQVGVRVEGKGSARVENGTARWVGFRVRIDRPRCWRVLGHEREERPGGALVDGGHDVLPSLEYLPVCQKTITPSSSASLSFIYNTIILGNIQLLGQRTRLLSKGNYEHAY